MKQVLFILLTFSFLQSYSQTKADLKYEKDEMEDKEYLMAKRSLILNSGSKKVLIDVALVKDAQGKWNYNGLVCISSGLSSCQEEDEIIILFTNGQKLKMTMWNKFNCQGYAFFDADRSQGTYLFRPVKKIRFTSGKSGEYVEKDFTTLESTYFTNLEMAVADYNRSSK